MNREAMVSGVLAAALACAVQLCGSPLPMRGICGHQGDMQNFPGNTVESLAAAVKKGVAMVEFDLQRCKTGEFVLFHDGTLQCAFAADGSRGTGRIADYTLAELKKFTVGRRVPCRLATFDEALAVLPKSNLWINVHCYVERKYVGEIARKIVAEGRKHQAFVCGTLSQIKAARAAVPDIMACNMSRPGPRNRDWTEAENMAYALDTVTNGCQFLQLCRRWPARFSRIVHDAGAKVNFFRSDRPDDIARLLADGVDFILTNHPGEMVPRFAETVGGADSISYIAHQGEEALAPSHSKAAYRLAVEHGLDYMKLDVRGTKDGHVVLQHDATLKATMGWDARISDLTLAEIRAKGRCRTRTQYTNETIVTLPEALEISKGMRKGVWIDFKHFSPAFAQKVFGLLDAAGYTDDRIMVATFTKPALAWVQQNRPGVRRVAHTAITLKEDGFHVNAGNPERAYANEKELADALDAHGKALGLYGFNMPAPTFRGRKGYDTTPALIADLKRRGYWISIWFVYNPAAGEFYRKAGADAFVTNCKANTFPQGEAAKTHEYRTVTVSKDFGFDPEDSTRFLQAALSSGAAKVIIDRQASDWVTMPIRGASNQTIVFGDGVTLRAKPGQFHGRADCLLSYVGCTNVTLSGYGATLMMDRAAYDRPPYTKSEHRHTLSLRGGRDIRVEGLTLSESGGDGVYIVPLRRGNGQVEITENVTLKDVKCVHNYRQGLSVIAVRGLLCDNCDFSETAGTPPQSGVDFEPNWPDEVLQGIVFRNCRFENNKGRGFEFYLGNLNGKSEPVTARFENCTTRGNINGFEYQQRRMKFNDLPRGGRVELANCTFERSTHAGVLIIDKPKYSAEIVFRGCRLADCCTVATNGPDIQLQTRLWDTPPVGGVDFGGIEIIQPFPRPKFTAAETDWTAPGVTVPRLASGGHIGEEPPLGRVRVVDPSPGAMYVPEGLCPAGSSRITLYADRARKVSLRAQILRLGKQPVVPAQVKVWRGGDRMKVRLPDVTAEPVELSFSVPEAGFYTLETDAGRHALRILEADVPLAVKVDGRPQSFAMVPGAAYLWTDARQPFALFAGANSYEKGAARLFAPSGEEVWSRSPIVKWERFQPNAASVQEGLWRIVLELPKGMRRTIMLDAPGTSGYLFMSAGRYWR